MENEIIVNGETYVKKELINVDLESVPGQMKYLIGKYVIVRCRDAGVHAGVLIDYQDRVCVLKESKRMWYFKTIKDSFLSAAAEFGITNESKTGVQMSGLIVLTETCELIECTKEAEKLIRNAPTVKVEDE